MEQAHIVDLTQTSSDEEPQAIGKEEYRDSEDDEANIRRLEELSNKSQHELSRQNSLMLRQCEAAKIATRYEEQTTHEAKWGFSWRWEAPEEAPSVYHAPILEDEEMAGITKNGDITEAVQVEKTGEEEGLKPDSMSKNHCDSPSDALLKTLIKCGSGGAGKWPIFEFRSMQGQAEPEATARYDDSGMIIDEKRLPRRFPSLAQWAKAIKGRAVSVKPCVYFKAWPCTIVI